MLGSSRGAFAEGHDAFVRVTSSDADPMVLAGDLFAVSATLDSSAALRRAIVDPSREPSARQGLAKRLFGGKITDAALEVLTSLAGGRWAADRDFTDSVENLAVEAAVVSADRAGRLDDLEDELFRFGRVVDGNHPLREAVTDRSRSAADKATLVATLLGDKVGPETQLLTRQAVVAPRGRRFDRAVEVYEAIAAKRREELTATVTSAVALDPTQRARLGAALSEIYGRQVQLNLAVDPEVLGGIRVAIGDEVVDGTILRRLDDARRRLAG